MTAPSPTLIRTLGRWTLVGLVLNSVLGSGVYGLPSTIAGRLGGSAWVAWLVAAAAIGVIMLCFAEVASRFDAAGGPYLYARVAFGSYAAVQMGWLAYLVRLTATATNANLFVIYLAEFFPAVSGPGAGAVVLVLLLGGLAVVNARGIRQGALTSNVLVTSKILPLVLFGVVGLGLAVGRGVVTPDSVPPAGTGDWIQVLLLLIFAYGGFEAALVPLGEAKDPRRDAPFALLVALAACTGIYTLAQLTTSFTLPDAGTHARPLADAARVLAGPGGAAFMAVGALLSLYGYVAAGMINVPRLTYAMAERGDIPAVFGRVHHRFRTPIVSIAAYAGFSFLLAVSGSFLSNLTLSAVSRLATYGLVCLALPVLRARDGRDPAVQPAAFRLGGGPAFAIAGVGVSLLLATRMTLREAAILAVVIAIASGVWYRQRRAGRA